jgi:hypothetical protein
METVILVTIFDILLLILTFTSKKFFYFKMPESQWSDALNALYSHKKANVRYFR